MATNDESNIRAPDESDMLPDEAAVLPHRGQLLDDTDDDDFLTTEDAADRLGIELE